MSEQGQGQEAIQDSAREQGCGGKLHDFLNDTPHHTSEPELVGHSDAMRDFIASTVIPGFEAARASLEGNSRQVRIVNNQHNATLLVAAQGREEFSYTVRAHVAASGVRPMIETTGAHGGQRVGSGNPWGGEWMEGHRLSEITPDAVTQHVLAAYTASTNA